MNDQTTADALEAWLQADQAEWLALEPFLHGADLDLDGKPIVLNKKRFRQVAALHQITEESRSRYMALAGRSNRD